MFIKKVITPCLLNQYFTCIYAGAHVTKGHNVLHMAVLAFALLITVFCVLNDMFYCLTTKDLTNKKLFRSHAMHSVFCCSSNILNVIHLMKISTISKCSTMR